MNIFVAKLDYSTTDQELRAAFEQYGDVSSAKVIMDKMTGNSKGFGFVEMPNDDEANDAIANLNDAELAGRTIVVKEATPREDRPRRGGGGGGYDSGRPRRSGGYSGGYGGGSGYGGGRDRGDYGGGRDQGNSGGGGRNRIDRYNERYNDRNDRD